MPRRHRAQSKRYASELYNGSSRRKNWRRRRKERIEDEQRTENYYRRHYRSILMYIFAKKRKRTESLKEYRLRLINLELISCIIFLVLFMVFILCNL